MTSENNPESVRPAGFFVVPDNPTKSTPLNDDRFESLVILGAIAAVIFFFAALIFALSAVEIHRQVIDLEKAKLAASTCVCGKTRDCKNCPCRAEVPAASKE